MVVPRAAGVLSDGSDLWQGALAAAHDVENDGDKEDATDAA